MIFQRRTMFDPVAGIQVSNFAVLCFHYLLLRLMDMPADDVIVFLFYGKFGGDEFEVVDLADGLIDLRHYPFRDGDPLATKGFQYKVNESIEADQEIIAAAAQFCQDPGASFGRIVKNVAVEYP